MVLIAMQKNLFIDLNASDLLLPQRKRNSNTGTLVYVPENLINSQAVFLSKGNLSSKKYE